MVLAQFESDRSAPNHGISAQAAAGFSLQSELSECHLAMQSLPDDVETTERRLSTVLLQQDRETEEENRTTGPVETRRRGLYKMTTRLASPEPERHYVLGYN